MAERKEPGVTAVLKALESDKAHLKGLEYRLKTVESITRKILSDAHDMEISPAEASKNIQDSLRYTFMINDKDYVETTRMLTDILAACGFSVVKFKNYWVKKDTAYQGINAQFRDKYGYIFEIQFHTPDSYTTKEELAHPYYEIIKKRNRFSERKG